MTKIELLKHIESAPDNAEILYVHNQYGRIVVDTVEIKEENKLSGEKFHTITFSASFEEN